MACNNSKDLTSGLLESSHLANNGGVLTPFIALTPAKYVRGVTVRVDTPGALVDFGFKYLILKLTTPGDPSTYTVYYATAQFLIAAGQSGYLTSVFTTPVLVPADGGVYYGAIQQGMNSGAAVIKWMWTNTGRPGTDLASSAVMLSAGNTISFSTALMYPNHFVSFSEEICDTSQVVLTPASPIVRPTIPPPPDYQRWAELDADDILAVTTVDSSVQTNKTPLGGAGLSGSVSIDSASYVLTVVLTPEPVEIFAEVDTGEDTRTVLCTATDLVIRAEFDPSQTTYNKTAQLTAADLIVRNAIGIPTVFSWSLVPLTGESTRTPDSGIELVYERTGLPKEYTWYTKPRFNFNLKTAPLAFNAYSALMSYCNLNRYEEFEFVWVHDYSRYLCTFVSEPIVTMLRSSTALGNRYVVSIELTGRGV